MATESSYGVVVASEKVGRQIRPDLRCPGCGCELSDYEIFACRLRGLKRPVCVGCLASALVSFRDHVYPLMRGLEQLVLDLAERTGGKVELVDAQQGKDPD
jgi:hypothetical protein